MLPARFKRWLEQLLHTHDTPHRTALAYAVGVFFGFSPVLGLHTVLGLAIAFLFGLNRIAVVLGIYSNLPWILPAYYTPDDPARRVHPAGGSAAGTAARADRGAARRVLGRVPPSGARTLAAGVGVRAGFDDRRGRAGRRRVPHRARPDRCASPPAQSGRNRPGHPTGIATRRRVPPSSMSATSRLREFRLDQRQAVSRSPRPLRRVSRRRARRDSRVDGLGQTPELFVDRTGWDGYI